MTTELSASNPQSTSVVPAALQQAMRDAHMVPLWESPTAHKLDVQREQAYCWPWSATRPIMMGAGEVQSPSVVERRVISLVNPKSLSAMDEATTGTISATLQMLKAGETARAHRHSMNALRFVLEGSGGETLVEGKACPMERGDLILTPAWCWHHHTHRGGPPMIWLDVLDVALHLALGTDSFEPGPAHDIAPQVSDSAFAVPAILPQVEGLAPQHSPVFRYPWAQAVQAVQAAPLGSDGTRRVRYADPLTGGPSMPLLDSGLMQIEAGTSTRALRTSASTVCCVVEGEGHSEIGDTRIEWKPNDVFTVPAQVWTRHRPHVGPARIFTVTNAPVYRRLGLLNEAVQD